MNWNKTLSKNYFLLVKFAGLISLIGYHEIYGGGALSQKALHILLGACFLLFAVLIEWNKCLTILVGEGILAIMAVFLFPVTGNYFILICILDAVSYRSHSAPSYLIGYTTLFLFLKEDANLVIPFTVITFLILIYLQEKLLIHHYLSHIRENEKTEGTLKLNMEREKREYLSALRKSRLKSENDLLIERNRITQAMHDKLGHSINGSLYQLEAAKLLIEKEPEKCHHIIQAVIDQLRISMDEIRLILRQEKPDSKRMAVLSLQSLCSECEERYQIKTTLTLSDDLQKINNSIWEIILDNTYEAVTNALKYAKCQTISISITVLNQVVRCSISDDGVGASHYTEGMGIAGMKKRVREIQGFLDIEHELGFHINMVLPIKQD